MSFFGLSQRSPDCNGDVIAWAEVPKLIHRRPIIKRGQLACAPDFDSEEFIAMLAAIANGVDDRDCWWEGGMAG